MDHPPRSLTAPRLLLVVSVLACLFGWGHSVASAASAADVVSAPVAAPEQTLRDAGHGHGVAGHAEAGHADEGHAGHDAGHAHSVSCMASSLTAAFGAVAAPDATLLVIAAVPPPPRSLAGALPVEGHRAPSIATLCVLRT